jgi:hypothetical protein
LTVTQYIIASHGIGTALVLLLAFDWSWLSALMFGFVTTLYFFSAGTLVLKYNCCEEKNLFHDFSFID